MFQKPKIGLALGGGGARGLAHIGVLRIIERHQIPIHVITGTSSGALIGAMYAQYSDANLIEHKLRNYLVSRQFKKTGINHLNQRKMSENFFSQLLNRLKERIVINLAHSRTSLVKNKRLIPSLQLLLKKGKIEETNIALGIVASDLITGKDILFTSGDIITAVAASSSLPGFLPPVETTGYLLLDGCITQLTPVKAAFEMGAQIVIAVDISQNLEPRSDFKNIIDIMLRTSQMTTYGFNQLQLEKADLVIKPEVGQFHWSDFNQIDFIIKAGEYAAERVVSSLKKLTTRKYLLLKKIHLK